MDPLKKFVAGRTFSLQGKPYTRGDEVDVSGLDKFQLGKLLDRRYLLPILEPAQLEEDPVIP